MKKTTEVKLYFTKHLKKASEIQRVSLYAHMEILSVSQRQYKKVLYIYIYK